MLRLRNSVYLLLIVALIAAPLAFSPSPAAAQVEYTCLPTCEGNDARFLSLAGAGLATIADQPIILTLTSPATAASIEIGIFDGNTAGMWDFGSTEAQYTVYADPLRTGSTSTMVAQRLGSSMPNNENNWSNFVVPNADAARSPSGNYFYRMEVRPLVPNTSFWSNFKVRTDGLVMLNAQPFSYVAPLLTDADRGVIYPNYPNLGGTTYNGRFDFHIYVPVSVSSMILWDGDFDHGSFDRVNNDTDDFNTPGQPFLPPWAAPASTNFEGVAVGRDGTTGAPSDDSSSPVFQRAPSIVYDLVLPNGTTYTNNNPTGNLEWEQFVLGPASNPSLAPDFPIVGRLPSGLYSVHGRGVDISNLNAWRFEYNVVGVCSAPPAGGDPNPCKPELFPFKIGDTVFVDPNNNGVQDPGEVGIPGVRVYLLDVNSQPVNDINGNPIFAVTDATGTYSFNVPAGTYSVRVGAENFNPGGPLAGNNSTTGGETLTRTVTNANVLTYDFGYRQPPPPPVPYLIGDKVFNDTNGNGVQDVGETGIPGVVVYLLDSNGQPVNDNNGNSSAVTDANGNYNFEVFPGTYSVRVGAENFNPGGPLAGTTSTTGGETLTRTVTNANVLTYDFGYHRLPPPPLKFLIGDRVFNDTNGNGVQDLGETGIPGVVVYLLDSNGQPISDVNGNSSATTDATGTYSFEVNPGTYSVRVGVENFNLGGPLAGATSTTGGETLTRTVTDADVLSYDFGYRFPPTVCVVTPGIWKTTFKNRWPVESITVAGVTYTREQAILIMSTAPKYDMTYLLFNQIVAVKLNILAGNPSTCIDEAVEIAETWLMTYPLGSGVALTSPEWKAIMFTFKDLDNYNKGRLCAEACIITPVPPPTKPPKPVKLDPVSGR